VNFVRFYSTTITARTSFHNIDIGHIFSVELPFQSSILARKIVSSRSSPCSEFPSIYMNYFKRIMVRNGLSSTV